MERFASWWSRWLVARRFARIPHGKIANSCRLSDRDRTLINAICIGIMTRRSKNFTHMYDTVDSLSEEARLLSRAKLRIPACLYSSDARDRSVKKERREEKVKKKCIHTFGTFRVSSAQHDVRIRMHQCLPCRPSPPHLPPFRLGVQELRSVRCTVKGSVNNFVHCRDYNMDGWQDNYWRPFESNCFLH